MFKKIGKNPDSKYVYIDYYTTSIASIGYNNIHNIRHIKLGHEAFTLCSSCYTQDNKTKYFSKIN